MAILSPEPEISNIHWPKIKKGQKLKATEVVFITGGDSYKHDLVLVKLASGGYACSRDISKAAYMPGSWPWMDPVIRGLVALGAISKEAGDAHLQRCKDVVERYRRRYAAESLRDTLKELGLDMTPEQQAFVDANARQKLPVDDALADD